MRCSPHITAHAAACRFVKESGAGGRWRWMRWGAARAADAASPLLPHLRGAVRGGACGHGCGQRTRGIARYSALLPKTVAAAQTLSNAR